MSSKALKNQNVAPKVTRFALQKALTTDIAAALDKAFTGFNLNPADPDANRRAFRAIVTVAACRLMDMGIPAQVIAVQAIEAVQAEMNHRTAAGIASTAFTNLPPAQA